MLAEDIGDNGRRGDPVRARGPPGHTLPPTGADKTTLVLYQRDDHPGGLLELLEQFAARGVNMTRLESRPTGEAMGSYCFSIDIEGHVADERVAETLMGLRRVCAQVRYLGSYARADGRPRRRWRARATRSSTTPGTGSRVCAAEPAQDLLGEAYLCCDRPVPIRAGPCHVIRPRADRRTGGSLCL